MIAAIASAVARSPSSVVAGLPGRALIQKKTRIESPMQDRHQKQEPADDEAQHVVRRTLALSYSSIETGANDSFDVGLDW